MNKTKEPVPPLPMRLERRVGGWISIEDRLPEWASRDDTPCFIEGKEIGATLTSEKVLVAIAPDNVVRIDNLVSLEGAAHCWFDVYGKRVTHWMPLPEVPNGKLTSGAAADKRDAERYRWLRDGPWHNSTHPEIKQHLMTHVNRSELDRVIDAFMAAKN